MFAMKLKPVLVIPEHLRQQLLNLIYNSYFKNYNKMYVFKLQSLRYSACQFRVRK